MAVWVSTTNFARGYTPGLSTSSETGYAAADVSDGVLGRAWRSSASATSFTFTYNLGASRTISLVGAFDVDNVTTGAWGTPAVKVETATSASFLSGVTQVGTFSLSSRGDGVADIRTGGVGVSAQHWRFTITPSASSTIEVGELWLGNLTVLTRGFAERSDSVAYRTITNESDTGNEFTSAVADARYGFTLGWDAMTSSDLAEFQALQLATQGRRYPCVLVPDSAAGVGYHGRFGDELSWEHDDPIRKGVGLEFIESGRAL